MAATSVLERQERVIRRVCLALGLLLILMEAIRDPVARSSAADLVPVPAPSVVRVRLGRLGPGPWRIDSRSGLRLEASGSVTTVPGPVVVGRDGITSGDTILRATSIAAADGALLEVDGSRYPGRIILGAERPILAVPVEDYVVHVLPSEMPLHYPPEALRAQSVAARSYACAMALRRRDRRWDVRDDASSQVFDAESTATERARELVASTRGIVLMWRGRILPAYFSANCGGKTRSAGSAFGGETLPPLRGVKCGFCDWSPTARWVVSIPLARLVAGLGLRFRPNRASIVGGEDSESDRVSLSGDGHERLLGLRDLRSLVGRRAIRSPRLTKATIDGEALVVAGRGFGHGVGLCQNGARGLADAGRNALEILRHYYPEATFGLLTP